MDYEIRPATTDDLSALADIFQTNMNEEPYSYDVTEDIATEVIDAALKYETVLLATTNDEIIGYVSASPYSWVQGTHVWMSELHVRVDVQGEGIGTALLEALESHFHNQGIKHIEFTVREDCPATQFYEKHGYERAPYVMYRKTIE